MSVSLTQLHCKYCRQLIPPAAIKNDQLLVICPACQGAHVPADFIKQPSEPSRRQYTEIPLPPGITIERGENTLRIIRPWVRHSYLILILVTLLWLLITCGMAMLDGFFTIFVLLLAFLFGVGIIVGKTIIIATPDKLVVTHAPLPLRPGLNLPVITIDQVYVTERAVSGRNGGLLRYEYDLYLKSKDGHLYQLVRGGAESIQVLYLEQQLEKFLNIVDRPIQGEIGHFVSLEKEQQWGKTWQAFADHNNLLFTTDKIDKFSISGDYRGCQIILDVITKRKPGRHKVKAYGTRMTVAAHDLLHNPFSPRLDLGTGKRLTLKDMPHLLNPAGLEVGLKGRIKGDKSGKTLTYIQSPLEISPPQLQFLLDSLANLAFAQSNIILWGGESVPLLEPIARNKQHPAHILALRLLQNIIDATSQWQAQVSKMFCPTCLAYWSEHKIDLEVLSPRTYYGCRLCGKSSEFLIVNGPIVAVLDHKKLTEPVTIDDNQIRGNWFTRRTLFDFDRVEIIRATDEEVERFAVKAGNDTDPLRQPRYKKIQCLVAENCGLSENSVRILQRIFGEVIYVK